MLVVLAEIMSVLFYCTCDVADVRYLAAGAKGRCLSEAHRCEAFVVEATLRAVDTRGIVEGISVDF